MMRGSSYLNLRGKYWYIEFLWMLADLICCSCICS